MSRTVQVRVIVSPPCWEVAGGRRGRRWRNRCFVMVAGRSVMLSIASSFHKFMVTGGNFQTCRPLATATSDTGQLSNSRSTIDNCLLPDFNFIFKSTHAVNQRCDHRNPCRNCGSLPTRSIATNIHDYFNLSRRSHSISYLLHCVKQWRNSILPRRPIGNSRPCPLPPRLVRCQSLHQQ